jgi:hypothetical protein
MNKWSCGPLNQKQVHRTGLLSRHLPRQTTNRHFSMILPADSHINSKQLSFFKEIWAHAISLGFYVSGEMHGSNHNFFNGKCTFFSFSVHVRVQGTKPIHWACLVRVCKFVIIIHLVLLSLSTVVELSTQVQFPGIPPVCPTRGIYFPSRRTYVRWLSGRMALPVVSVVKKISSSVPHQSISLRPALSHVCCGTAVHGWGRGLEIFSTCVRIFFLDTIPWGGLTPRRLSFFN